MSRARSKGTAAESAVVAYLRANGFPHAERRALSGSKDRGDIAGVPDVACEVKAAAAHSYGAWLAEAAAEAGNADARYAVVIHKPKGTGAANVASWRVVMTLETFCDLVREDT